MHTASKQRKEGRREIEREKDHPNPLLPAGGGKEGE